VFSILQNTITNPLMSNDYFEFDDVFISFLDEDTHVQWRDRKLSD